MKNVATKPKCKKQLRHGFVRFPCSRNAVLDGWCRTHHPDAVEKRAKIATERFNAKEAKSIPARFERAQERITELEAERENLWEWSQGISHEIIHDEGCLTDFVRLDDLKKYLGVQE